MSSGIAFFISHGISHATSRVIVSGIGPLSDDMRAQLQTTPRRLLFRLFGRCSHLHGEKNLAINARELMNSTRGVFVVRMPQASLAMLTMTSCVQCTTSSLVLNAPTHLRKSLGSVGFIATLSCAKPVRFSMRYFQEIPRIFFVRLLAIAF